MSQTATIAADPVAQLRAEVAELREQIADLSREVFSPKEIAKRFRIDSNAVYAACETGLLVAEQRPTHGGRSGYLITLADARSWRARVRKTNQ